MAAQFKITDGTTTIDLLGSSSYIRYDSLPELGTDIEVSFAKSGFGGAGVAGFGYSLAVRTYKLTVSGADQDTVATTLQTLFRLLRKAALYHSSPRYLTPVYIIQQATNESNARYALVYGVKGFNVNSPFVVPFRNNNLLPEVEIPIIQDPFWQPTAPGQLPSKMQWYPVWEKEVHESGDFENTLIEGSCTITDEDEWIVFTGDAGTNLVFGKDYKFQRAKATVVRLKLDFSDLTMAAGDELRFLLVRDAVNGWNSVLSLLYDGSDYNFQLAIRDDTGSWTNDTVPADKANINDIVYIAKAATGVGVNDGVGYLYLDGGLVIAITGIDNDTKETEDLLIGFTALVNAGTQGSLKISRLAYTIGYDDFPTRAYVTNHEVADNIPDNIYVHDASGPTSTRFVPGDTYFPDPVASGDALEFYSPLPPFCCVIPAPSTAGVLGTINLKLAYWNGAWTDLTLGTDYMCYPGPTLKDCFRQTDEDIVIFLRPGSDAVTRDGGYAVRIYEAHATPSWSTAPVSHKTRRPEIVDSAHLDIPSWALKGDAPAKLLLRLYSGVGGDDDVDGYGNTSRIIIGARSRGLHRFRHMLPLVSTPAFSGWTISYGTDTAAETATSFGGGSAVRTTFATDEATVMRVRLAGTNMLRYYRGAFKAYLIGKQTAGSEGDVSVKLRFGLYGTSNEDPKWDTKELNPQAVSGELDALDFGEINLPFTPEADSDAQDVDLIIEVHAGCLSGKGATVDYYMHQLVLIPIDEWHVELDDPVTNSDYGTSALRGNKLLEIDGGILKDRTVLRTTDLVPLETWSRRGAPPMLEPQQETRLCFLILRYTGSWGSTPLRVTPGYGLAVEAYVMPQYASLIGDASQ